MIYRLLRGSGHCKGQSWLQWLLSFQKTSYQSNYAIGISTRHAAASVLMCNFHTPALKMHLDWQNDLMVHQREYATARKMPQPRLMTPPVLVEKLEAYYQQNLQLNSDMLERFIKTLESQPDNYNQLLTTDRIHFLLRACGTQMPAVSAELRISLFERLWAYLAKHELLDSVDYITRLHVLQCNRAPLVDFNEFLQDFRQRDSSGNNVSQDIYTDLLKTAAACGNIQQVTMLLAEMRSKEIALTELHFNTLLLGHGRAHDLHGCSSVLDNMLAAGILPSIETQSVLVAAYMENNKPELAIELLRKYHGQFNAGQVWFMLRSLLHIASPDSNLIELLVYEIPREFSLAPEVPTPLRELCVEFLHNGKLAVVKSIVSLLPTPNFNENQSIDTYGVFLLQELFRAKSAPNQILDVVQILQESGKNTRALHIATEIALRRNPDTALAYFEALAKQEPLRPQYFWPLILYNYKNRDGEAGVLQVLKQMQDFKVPCDQETIAHYVLPHLPLTFNQPVSALKALDAVGVKPSQIFVDVLTHLLVLQRLEEACTLLEVYTTKVKTDDLISVISNAAINARATKRYQQFAKMLAALAKRSENRKSDWVGQLLLHMLNTQMRLRSDLKAFQRFIIEMSKVGLSISPGAIEALKVQLEQCTKGDFDFNPIIEVLQRMSDRSIVLQNFNQDNCTGKPTEVGGIIGSAASTFIKHPRDMTIDELEFHLIELEAKRLNTRGVLRRLLQLCVRDGRLNRALEIKTKCEELKVQVSAGMLASILDMYIKLQDFPNATKSLENLQKSFPGFPVDEHKMIDYAALLVRENQLDAAKQLLKQRAAAQKVNGGDYVLKNVWKFLTNVAELAAKMPELPKERNLTRENFHFLLKLRYCNAHNTVLGPIVRERLLRGDVAGAIAEFQQLAEHYKCTPLQFEVLSLLVRLCNGHEGEVARYGEVSAEDAQQMLSTVTATIAKVYGTLNMNTALLLAFAQSGTENQLRRLLINPEFRINQTLLLKNCEYLGEESAITTLLRLARGARGHGRVVDEQNIYNMLLDHFAKENNCEAAINLYDRLAADDELKISQEFLRNLVQLLRVNNKEIPSNLALRAQII